MTAPQSLNERLRALLHDLNRVANEVPGIGAYGKDVVQRAYKNIQVAAAALDAKDTDIERLRADAKDEREDWQLQVAAWKDKADRRADEIALLKEGRQLHDEHADHLEHELARRSALLAQAAAALERIIEIGDANSGYDRGDLVASREIARQALAAIRAKEHP